MPRKSEFWTSKTRRKVQVFGRKQTDALRNTPIARSNPAGSQMLAKVCLTEAATTIFPSLLRHNLGVFPTVHFLPDGNWTVSLETRRGAKTQIAGIFPHFDVGHHREVGKQFTTRPVSSTFASAATSAVTSILTSTVTSI